MKKLKPKKTDEKYLRGWFRVATKNDEKKARKLAREYHENNP